MNSAAVQKLRNVGGRLRMTLCVFQAGSVVRLARGIDSEADACQRRGSCVTDPD